MSLVGVFECNSSARQVTLDRNQCKKPFAAAPTLQSSARPSLPPTRPYPYPFIREDARGTRRLHALPHCASLSFAAQASALMWPTPLHQHSVRAFERPPRPRSCRPSTVYVGQFSGRVLVALFPLRHGADCGFLVIILDRPVATRTRRVGVIGGRTHPICTSCVICDMRRIIAEQNPPIQWSARSRYGERDTKRVF